VSKESVVEPAAEPVPKPVAVWPAIRRLLHLAGRNQVWLYLATVMSILQVALTLGFNFTLARFIDAVSAGELNTYLYYLGLTAVLIALMLPTFYLRTRWVGLFGERTQAILRTQLAAQATVLPMRTLEERHSGDLLAVVNADLAKLKNLAGPALLDALSQPLMAVAALVALFAISWQLALASTLLIPLMFIILSQLNQPVAQRAEKVQQAVGETVSIAQDGLAGLMVTKAFNLARRMDERFGAANQRALVQGLSLTRLRAIIDGSAGVFNVLPFVLTLGYGGYLAVNGLLTFGNLLAFINLLNFVANPLGSLPPTLANISEAAGALQRTYQLLDQPPERNTGQDFPATDAGDGEIVRFEHAHFAYDDEPVLKDVSLSIHAGQTVAIVGPSGGGKSTLLKLLLGFYEVEPNHVYLFGHDLNEWSLAAVRQHMAFVAQDTYLFPVSLAENIACGQPGVAQADIERAARMANIHDFILSLPQGYATLAGERGARLSGGQRQRLSLARAILKDAPILVLDEPTSALDSESERLVQEALARFMAGRTTIVVAHRLSTVRDADRVVVLAEGRSVEQGTHDELMAREGRYKELYLRQFDENPVATSMAA
jgi:subfamily B ATP-binding cassette protein MsbA/ATP-binding cassette subfamily B protein AbcA/BmrA